MDYKITRIEKHNDTRGDLIVFLKKGELKQERKDFGQIYFVTFGSKGVIRGNHYHKKWREWFGVISGEVQVELEDVLTKEHVSFKLSSYGTSYIRLEIGPNIAHAFKSLTPQVSLLNYADSEWSKEDSFPYIMIKEKDDEK